mgnify:CR=1 FL=1|jgi:hypothetical protein
MNKIPDTVSERCGPYLLSALCVILCSSLMTIGCSAPNRMTHLRDTVRVFNQQIRWGQWPSAASHVDMKARSEWLATRLAAAQNLKMSDVRLVRVSSDGPRSTEATVIVTLSWYRISDMKVKNSHWVQTWSHTGHGWKLTKEKRQIAAPKPPPKDTKKPHWP